MSRLTVVQTDDNWFEVLTGFNETWVGNVWVNRGTWTAQDFDGDTTDGFETLLGAAQFCEQMAAASC